MNDSINKPWYGAINSDGKWFDGKNWVNCVAQNTKTINTDYYEQFLKQKTKLNESFDNGCHIDGVFECPRCWRPHFIIDNFDLLCDGCSEIVVSHINATEEQIIGIQLFKEKAKKHYSGLLDPDILARKNERDILMGRKESFKINKNLSI